jgi:hypothetical protein
MHALCMHVHIHKYMFACTPKKKDGLIAKSRVHVHSHKHVHTHSHIGTLTHTQ